MNEDPENEFDDDEEDEQIEQVTDFIEECIAEAQKSTTHNDYYVSMGEAMGAIRALTTL